MKVFPKSCKFTFRTLERGKTFNESIVGIYRKNTTQLLWKGKRKDSHIALGVMVLSEPKFLSIQNEAVENLTKGK